MSVLEKYVKLEVSQQLQELCAALELSSDYAANVDAEKPINCYIIRLLHVLHTLQCNINFHSDAKEDLISVAHLKLCIQATQELAYYALRQQLHPDFYKSPVFRNVAAGDLRCPATPLIMLSVQFFTRFFTICQLHIANCMELVQRDLLAVIISLRIEELSAEHRRQLDMALDYLWEHESKADFFRHVLLLKATPQLCPPLAKELHQQLLGKLQSPHGFASLVAALQTASAQDVDSTRQAEIVANIVGQRGYSQRLQQRLIQQIFDFLAQLSKSAVAVLSLRRLYELNESNRERIKQILYSHWQPLTAPEDLINGLIIWEQEQLSACLRRWQQLFCSSTIACLPSSLLAEYLPLLLQVHKQLPETLQVERQALAELITRCLDNRKNELDLAELLQHLFQGTGTWKSLHPRIRIVTSAQTNLLTVQVGQEGQQEQQGAACVLPPLLMSSNNHALTCKVFLALLRLVVQQLAGESTSRSIDLLSTEAELADFLHDKFQLKLELLVALDQLIWHEPLKAQLADLYSKQFIQLVVDLLQVETAEDQTLIVILLLLQEILERSEQLQLADSTRRLQQPLQRLLARDTSNVLLQNAVQSLLQLLNGGVPKITRQTTQTSFQTARDLIEQRQPHLQVYGIQMMLEALRNKDATFTSQAHRILALALSTLKTKESYTFLNCVRLFVALVHLMEAEVLDMLSDEYLAETGELDYRLVVGEAILKAANEIGGCNHR